MVTIPTIDQISGTTVMNKLRSLIHTFIEFATDVSDEMDYVSEQSQEAYNMASSIDLTNYYTKSEVDNLIASIDLSDYYTKTEIDTTFTNYYTKTEIETALALKQDNLTATNPIQIEENNIKLAGYILYNSDDWTTLFDNQVPLKDMVAIMISTGYGCAGIIRIHKGVPVSNIHAYSYPIDGLAITTTDEYNVVNVFTCTSFQITNTGVFFTKVLTMSALYSSSDGNTFRFNSGENHSVVLSKDLTGSTSGNVIRLYVR